MDIALAVLAAILILGGLGWVHPGLAVAFAGVIVHGVARAVRTEE